jgi:pyridoxal phosphate phosphatase PHOSPHO2
LLAFDFDHTLIDENSDLSVKKLAPNGQLPESIETQYSATGWTEYMAAIFKYQCV